MGNSKETLQDASPRIKRLQQRNREARLIAPAAASSAQLSEYAIRVNDQFLQNRVIALPQEFAGLKSTASRFKAHFEKAGSEKQPDPTSYVRTFSDWYKKIATFYVEVETIYSRDYDFQRQWLFDRIVDTANSLIALETVLLQAGQLPDKYPEVLDQISTILDYLVNLLLAIKPRLTRSEV